MAEVYQQRGYVLDPHGAVGIDGRPAELPLPNLCPGCREQRRLVFRNEWNITGAAASTVPRSACTSIPRLAFIGQIQNIPCH
jgi:hypothetical protein